MKKYIEIQKHEELVDGDECRYVYSEEWRPNVHRSQMVGFEYRRLVPHTGDVQFLMCVSILVPVIVNCDGLAQDEIEMITGDAVIRKIKGDVDSYICHENIDWPACKVDELRPEPKNPGKYRLLEVGDTIQSDDEYLFPGGWQLVPSIMVGDEFNGTCDAKSIRRPITEPQYRPFVEGDVIERGDQLRLDRYNDFSDIKTGPFPRKIDQSIIDSPDFRKLIK